MIAMQALVAGDRSLLFGIWSERLRHITNGRGASSSEGLLIYGCQLDDGRLAIKHSSARSRHLEDDSDGD